MRVVATAGHVDHGKSSLVLALTGTDPDRFEEEKRRGLTIDLGFAHTTLPSGAGISFVDVPGHVRFLKNMLAGVGAVDACLFVVAATEGWKPQSEEHLRILELLGVGHGVVALTKVDVVDDEWEELARMEVADHLDGTFLAGAPIVGVAAPTGRGLDELRAALDDLVARTPAAADRGRPRLWVDRVFAAKGSGTVVTGTLAGGAIASGDHLAIGPAARPVRVRAVQSLGRAVDRIEPGHRVALNLAGVDHIEVGRGDAVVRAEQWKPTRRLDARLDVLPSIGHTVTRKGAFLAYFGSGELPVRLRLLGRETEIAPGAAGLVRLHLPVALPLLPGDRFVLRDAGRSETVGGGVVLDVAPVLPATRARPDRSATRVAAERGWIEVDELERLTGERVPPTIGRWVAGPERLVQLADELHAQIDGAGALGLDIAMLDERAREVLAALPDVEVVNGRARRRATVDPLQGHPFVAALEAAPFVPPGADGVDRAELRALVQRGLVVERDGVWFHPNAIEAAAAAAARLLAAEPEGFTASRLRDELGTTRKYLLPLVAELDGRGITRRRGDLRIAGPRLPVV